MQPQGLVRDDGGFIKSFDTRELCCRTAPFWYVCEVGPRLQNPLDPDRRRKCNPCPGLHGVAPQQVQPTMWTVPPFQRLLNYPTLSLPRLHVLNLLRQQPSIPAPTTSPATLHVLVHAFARPYAYVTSACTDKPSSMHPSHFSSAFAAMSS